MSNSTPQEKRDGVEERIATIIADCKIAGTSANETTRQVLEVHKEALHTVAENARRDERTQNLGDFLNEVKDCNCPQCERLGIRITQILTPTTPPTQVTRLSKYREQQ